MVSFTKRQHAKYNAPQLFDLVAGVERYPKFIPWVIATHVRRRTAQNIWADLTIGIGLLRKTFSTVAVLDRPHRIAINSHDPMFIRFEQTWTFDPVPEGGTNLAYHVDFKFRSRLLQALMDATFARCAGSIISAYNEEARRLYGGRHDGNQVF
jgi:coenzyme Q-binding protein COQ10